MLTIQNINFITQFEIQTDDNRFLFWKAIISKDDVYEFSMVDSNHDESVITLKREPEPNGMYLLSYSEHKFCCHVLVENIRDVRQLVAHVGRCITKYGDYMVI
jgi:hypothetical protein